MAFGQVLNGLTDLTSDWKVMFPVSALLLREGLCICSLL